MSAPLALLLLLGGAAPAELPPLDADGVDAAVTRCVEILLDLQENLDGDEGPGHEWPYEGVYREGGVIPPGYRVGGTAIGAHALLEAPSAGDEDADGERTLALERATRFVLDGLEAKRMESGFRGGYDVRGWGHAYALGYLLRLRALERVPRGLAERVDATIARLVRTLAETEIEERGGWNYARGRSARPSTFMTAATLQFLFEAQRQGEDVDAAVVERALAALEGARLDSGAFQYALDPAHRTGEGFQAVEGSTGRSPVCEVTLWLAGRGSLDAIRGALEAFFEHWEWLEARRRKTGTHEPPYMIAPYYFYFAHYHAARAIECLPEAERPALRARFLALLERVREPSGGFNDRVFPRSENYGTAMTLLGLLEPRRSEPARWESAPPETPERD